MKISIIGVGNMGYLFAKYFKDKFDIYLYDINIDKAKEAAEKLKVNYYTSLSISDSDFLFLSLPIEEIKKFLEDLYYKGYKDITVCEISSIKSGIFEKLKILANKGITTLCIHPLFGPGGEKLKKRKIVFIPVKDKEREEGLLKEIFKDFEIIVSSYEEHDKFMAYILSLTHIINLAFIKVLPDLKKLNPLAGSTFTLQTLLSGSILNDDQSLLSSIHLNNPYTKLALEDYIRILEGIMKLLNKDNKKEYEELIREVKEKYKKFSTTEESYQKLYQILEIFQE